MTDTFIKLILRGVVLLIAKSIYGKTEKLDADMINYVRLTNELLKTHKE